MSKRSNKTDGTARDLFGAPLPLTGETPAALFTPARAEPTAAERRQERKATAEARKRMAAIELAAIQAKTPKPIKWPPPWHKELPCDRRMRNQYDPTQTPEMFNG